MRRSIVAVVVGFVGIAALSIGTDLLLLKLFPSYFDAKGGTQNAGMLAFMLAYVTVYAVAGCWLTARLAPNRPMRHAMILGVLGFLFSVMGTITRWNMEPAWYNLIGLALVLPSAWLGGRLAERSQGVPAPSAAPAV